MDIPKINHTDTKMPLHYRRGNDIPDEITIKRAVVLYDVMGASDDGTGCTLSVSDSGGDLLFSLDYKDTQYPASGTVYHAIECADAGLHYILRHSAPHAQITGNYDIDHTITQHALWWYMSAGALDGYYDDIQKRDPYDIVPRYIRPLVKAAEDARDNPSDVLMGLMNIRVYSVDDPGSDRLLTAYGIGQSVRACHSEDSWITRHIAFGTSFYRTKLQIAMNEYEFAERVIKQFSADASLAAKALEEAGELQRFSRPFRAYALCRTGDALLESGEHALAESAYAQSLALLEAICDTGRHEFEYMRSLVSLHEGFCLSQLGESKRAIQRFEEGQDALARLARQDATYDYDADVVSDTLAQNIVHLRNRESQKAKMVLDIIDAFLSLA